MRKFRLQVDALEVESFESARVQVSFGTVRGAEDSLETCGCPAPPPSGYTECTCYDVSCRLHSCYNIYTHPCHCL